jgi:AcrR family transcriptional regulator
MPLQRLQIKADTAAKRHRRRTKDIRASILEAAAAEFGSRGYAGATTAAIAKRSGVAENQIFRHFNSKADLFRKSVFDPLNEKFEAFNVTQLRKAINGKESQITERYIRALSQFIAEQKRELLALVRSNADELGEASGIGKMGALGAFFQISHAMLTAKRGPNFKMDPRLVNRVSFATVLACVMFGDWLFPDELGKGEISSVLSDFIMHGLDGLSR